ncbi:MAG: hypothetical protein Q8P18_13465 [Pseudomonadota bacterium]|nr:hypothetical protein [Pseudomonadota bacterium]
MLLSGYMSPPARTSVSQRLGLVALLAFLAPAAGLLVAPAHAAPGDSAASTSRASLTPVALPSGQKLEDWADPLASRGLAASTSYGLPASGAGVSIIDRKDYWEMTVRSHAGKVETVNVAPCTTAEEREDLLFYMSTLIGPAPVVVDIRAAEAAVIETKPIAPTVIEPVAVKPAVIEPVAAKPAVIEPVAKASTTSASTTSASTTSAGTSPSSVEVVAPKKEPGSGFWMGAGGGVGMRPAAGVVGDLRIDAGWYVTPGVRLGAGLAGRTAATLSMLSAGHTMTDIDVVVEAAWAPPSKVAPVVGLYFGGASRQFMAAGEPVASGLFPIVGGALGMQIALGDLPIRLEPAVRLQGDLRAVELRSQDGLVPLSPIEVRAGLVLIYRPG